MYIMLKEKPKGVTKIRKFVFYDATPEENRFTQYSTNDILLEDTGKKIKNTEKGGKTKK